MTRYNHLTIEKKWQNHWNSKKIFKVDVQDNQPKYYVLDMFPYPSGAGLHVGHLIGYTATDIMARAMRQKGCNVLHPMGWDSFGLPAEQYAIRTGTHPAVTTETNIKKFKEQLNSLGYSYDWDRELRTSDPEFYKWTQWIFTRLYEKGLAYEAKMLVNYCPALGSVLANEEIEEGRSKEGGHLVERRPLRQWMLKITEYAERLLDDLEKLDWPESLKKLQRNWIGKSEGAEIYFPLVGKDEKISVFTTRPDTIYGVTYLVLSPEHPLVEKVTTHAYLNEVLAYQKKIASKSELERTELTKEKTGVFTGGYASNPLTKEKLPIWISDYVLMGYGTGAVMAVPSHDERDHQFSIKYRLPIVRVIVPSNEPELEKELMTHSDLWNGEGKYVNSRELDGSPSPYGKDQIMEAMEKKGFCKRTISYKLRDWLFSRQRYWGEPVPILHFDDGTERVLSLDELPLLPPQITNYKPSSTGESPLAHEKDWVEVIDPKTGRKAERETNTMPQWAGSCWYYLRFLDPQNQHQAWAERNETYWMPVDLYIGGAEHAVLHLLYARFWHKVFYDLKLVSTDEPFQKLCNQGLLVARSYKQKGGHYVNPEEVVEKNGVYTHWETGEILVSQIEKMSKSKLNGVSPDEVIEEFGADALRLYSMFMGPIEKEKVWNRGGVSGCKRFLNRFYEIATSNKVKEVVSFECEQQGMMLAHRLLKGVTHDTEKMLFNTAISKMMEFVNAFTQLSEYPKRAVTMAVQLLMPYAPHLAEELWQHLGEKKELSYVPLPSLDSSYLETEQVTYVIQVNGKLRGRLDLPKETEQQEIVRLAKADETIAKFLDGEIKKTIFVPGKLLNLVVEKCSIR
ncbi:MAG: leucine--tRNA ligase [Chlamydiia bacterium]|nr:leucine--tRNA ligase [Chlamydiia bacterium]